MDDAKLVLPELIRARENIKQKYNALKQGLADNNALITSTLKPIISPLERLSADRSVYDNGKSYVADNKVISETDEGSHTSLVEDGVSSRVGKLDNFNVNSWLKSKNRDRVYGVKQDSKGQLSLGESNNVVFDEKTSTMFIDNTPFPLTQGLLQLLFIKDPKKYNKEDLKNYKQVLVATSAHLTKNKKKVKVGGKKYANIISGLFSTSGAGLSKSLQKGYKETYIFWNDPNELVERLKLLLSSQAAGNTGVSNEILSIWEELFEAGIIQRMPKYV